MTDHPQHKIEKALLEQFGIKNVTLHYRLTQDELFYAAIENDRGRVSIDGDFNQQKAFPTVCLLYTSPSPRD